MSGNLPRRGNMNIQRDLQNLEAKKSLVAPGDSLYIVLRHSRMEWGRGGGGGTCLRNLQNFLSCLAVGGHTKTCCRHTYISMDSFLYFCLSVFCPILLLLYRVYIMEQTAVRRGNVLVFFAWLHLRHRHRNKPCHLYPTITTCTLCCFRIYTQKIACFTCQENLYL